MTLTRWDKRIELKPGMDVDLCAFSSKLHFIDLAGSERVKKSKVYGQSFKEMNQINLSLSTLGKCIRALGDDQPNKMFLPYRDSLITRILKDAFSSDVKLSVLVNVSSNSENMPETLSTLEFATNCKNAKTKIILPQHKAKHQKEIIREL